MTSKAIQSTICILLSVAIMFIAGIHFLSLYEREPIMKGTGVSRVGKLSDYFSKLKGTVADTDVFFLEGDQPGGTVCVFGGVHPAEPAGMLATALLVENAIIRTGRLIVIPRCNESAYTHNAPSGGYPSRFKIETPWGSRWFRFGDRLTNPVHQWPDPEVFAHYPSGQLLADFEVRNLNRNFPGRPDGTFTERLAYALTQLVRQENVGITIDLHEARPMNPIVNCIVAHERAKTIAATAVIDLDLQGIKIRLEPSPKKMRGMSHRELGDHTETIPMLLEVPNPIMDKLNGRIDETLVVTGKDDFYLKAASRGLLYTPYEKEGIPIEQRVGRHVSVFLEIVRIFSEFYPKKKIEIENVPEYMTIKKKGVGYFLRKPKE